MKNQFTYFALALVSLIISSCSQLSTLSVEKRHYRSGYYVDYNHGKKSKPEITQTNMQAEDAPQSLSANAVAEQEPVLYQKKVTTIEQSNAGKNITVAEKNEPGTQNKYNKSSLVEPASKATLSESIKKHFPSSKKQMKEDDELSMFWSVIVLIVIIWLIAYFTGGWGLGGLINLLLLVALVLLILWLLRIV